MATIEEAIARLVFEFESKGADKVGSDLDKINKSQDDISVSSQKTEQASISLEKSFDNLERRFVTTVRAQQDYANVQAKVNAAVQQNPALMERGNVVLDAAKEKFDAVSHKATEASGSFGLLAKALGLNVSEGSKAAEIATLLEARQLKLASSVGLVGEVLSILGPVGLTAVASLGSVLVVMDQMSQSAERMGQVAKEISSFASVTGLATNDVQSLRSEGTKFGLSFEETGSFVEKFTYQLEAAHSASGPLYDAIQKINPALAVQLALAKPGADSLNILAQAYKQAGDQAQKLALVRAAGGRNAGAEAGEFLSGIADKGGVAAVTGEVNKLDLLTKEQIEHWKTLSAQIEEASTTWKNNIASIFTGSVLESQKKFQDNLVDISRLLKSFSQSDAFAGIVSVAKNLANVLTLPAQVGASVPGKILQLARSTPSDQLPQSQDFAARFGDSTGAIQSAAPNFNSRFNDDTAQIKASNDASLQLTQTTNALTAAQEKYAQAQQAIALLQSTGVASEEAMTSARKSAGDALAVLATVEQQHIQSLNGAATGEETLKQRTDALTASLMQGKISTEDYNRALHGDTANQVAALEDQRSVIEATTGQMKIAAQYAADFDAQIRAGKSDQDAMAIASEKVANAEAAANKSITDRVQSLKDENDMIKARQNGTEATTAASIAYNNAISAGADETSAAALQAQTLANYTAQAAANAARFGSAMVSADAGLTFAAGRLQSTISVQQGQSMAEAENALFNNGTSFQPDVMPKGPLTFSAQGGIHATGEAAGELLGHVDLGPSVDLLQLQAQQQKEGMDFNAAFSKGGADAALNAVKKSPNTVGISDYDANVFYGQKWASEAQSWLGKETSTIDDKISSYDQLVQLQNAKTTDKGQQAANLQSEMDWLQTLPETISRDQKIISLQQSIDSLKSATDANTAATSATLNPLYSQGHGALAIGYYKAASGLDMIAQGPSSGDQVPFHAMINGGERVQITPKGQSSNDNSRSTQIINNNNFVFNNATTNNARRSQRQFAQGFGQLAAAGS